MGTTSLRVRLDFEDRSILGNTQRSDEMNHCWLLLKLQQHRTISDVCTHLLHIFNLHRSCPNGILLSMEGFALPPFESTEILKEKDIICVKKKGGSTPDACNLLDDVSGPGDDGLLHLVNDTLDRGTKVYQTDYEEVDEEQSQDEELLEETISKKRKGSTNLQNFKKKNQCHVVLHDDEDEAETEEIEKIYNGVSHPMKIISTKEAKKLASTSSKKIKSSSTVKQSEELQGNVEEFNHVTNALGAKVPSRSARRIMAKRQWIREVAKIAKKKPQQACSKPEIAKPKNKETNDQPKGLASKKTLQNGDVGTVVTRPRHIRFESSDEDEAAKQTGVSTINYSALVDVRNVKQYDPNATEPLNVGVDQTPMSDDKDATENMVYDSVDNVDVPKDSNPGEVNPWDRSISKKTEISKPNDPSTVDSRLLNPSSYDGAGPSTSRNPDANKAESPEVKEWQKGNCINPWLNANKPDPSQENNSGWSNVLGPTANDCENGSSWGRPWSAFVVSKSSSVIQQNGSSHGSWKPTPHWTPRGQGRGRYGSRGRGRNSN